ncbi:MAG: hypothetical protein ACOYVG_08980 [Bacteroidota bacterium]
MQTVFNERQLELTTIIINSTHFKLTSTYLIKHLGLKVKYMVTDQSGIRRMYLHAASSPEVHALEICLTDDSRAAEQFPVMLGANVIFEDSFFETLASDDRTFELTNIGSWNNVILYNQFRLFEYENPKMPICILPNMKSSEDYSSFYNADQVIDWLSIDDNNFTSSLASRDTWLHGIYLGCKHSRSNVVYYKNLGIYVDDVSDDYGYEFYHLLTDTNISIGIESKKDAEYSHEGLRFAVQMDETISQLPTDWATGVCFSDTKLDKAELVFNLGRFYYEFNLTDVNKCKWHLHREIAI